MVASEMATSASRDKIYVAVGNDVKESKAKLAWAVHRSGGNAGIGIIHVLVPSERIPIGGLGAGMPASSASEKMLRRHREKERMDMHKILDTYLRFCEQMGVQAEKAYIESKSVERGILELISNHEIKKLVMGAAKDRHYFREMTKFKSRKAMFIRDRAHISCQIWFICDGHLIHTRKAQAVSVVVEVPSDAPLPSPTTPSPQAGKVTASKSQSATLQRSGTMESHYSFRTPIASPSPNSTPSGQPNAASMLERQDTLHELGQFSRSVSHHLHLTPSVYHTGLSSFSDVVDMDENDWQGVLEEEATSCVEAEVSDVEGGQQEPRKRLYAEKLEEELGKVKGQLGKVMEELRIAQTQKSQLEDRFMATDQSRKELEQKLMETDELVRTFRQERELLRTDLENAMQEADEVRRRKGDSSTTNYFSEISMNEIEEAVRNFDPSLKIGEGGCGRVYKGSFRNTPVAIKIMKFPTTRGSQEFQQEVDVLSKVRHPNLITLIGACPHPCTLVYEYVPNGSLEDWLRSSNTAKQLPWQARIRIATELCSVLVFLHSCKPHSIVHGDVKPGNILLDAHLVTKLSDFGICRLLYCNERSSNNTSVVHLTDPKGTFGYMDPEFFVTRELTTKFDVYSFGIILLQLLTRRPAEGIANEVQRALRAGILEAILDPLAGEWPYMQAEELTHLALRCCEMRRRNRPDLRSDVWTVLHSIKLPVNEPRLANTREASDIHVLDLSFK